MVHMPYIPSSTSIIVSLLSASFPVTEYGWRPPAPSRLTPVRGPTSSSTPIGSAPRKHSIRRPSTRTVTPARISNSRAEAPGGGGEGGCGAVTGAVAGGGYRRVAGPRGAGWARPLLPPHSADHAGLTRSGLPPAQRRGTSLARRWPPCATPAVVPRMP